MTKLYLLKLPNRTSPPSSCISGTACSISCEISLFVAAANQEGILLATYASLASLARRNWTVYDRGRYLESEKNEEVLREEKPGTRLRREDIRKRQKQKKAGSNRKISASEANPAVFFRLRRLFFPFPPNAELGPRPRKEGRETRDEERGNGRKYYGGGGGGQGDLVTLY